MIDPLDLINQGIDNNIVELIKDWYEGSQARIVMDKIGPDFAVRRGVKQGDPLSPILFNCALEEVFRTLDWGNIGVKINGVFLSNLRFADDVVLFSESEQELSEMITSLNEAGKEAGLTINEGKTVLMTNSNNAGTILLEGKRLRWVESTVYLGQLLSFHNGTLKEVNRRISIAWKKYWSLKFVFKSAMRTELKSRVFDSCILPCLLYGAQVWATSGKIQNRLKVTQRSMERSMLNITRKDRIKNELIREKTRVSDVVEAALKIKWKWAGHVARMKEDRWAKRVTEWIPLDSIRRKGRPLSRWKDAVTGLCGTLWQRSAQNKKGWQNLGEAFALRWA